MRSDEIETIQSIKDKTRYYIEQCSPESNIRYTDYFNHTFIPDMVIDWNKQERYLYIRTTSDINWIFEDAKLLDIFHPIILTIEDFTKIKGVNEGLHQYYEIEQTTDLWSFNSGRVQEKMGVNKKKIPRKTPVSFVVIDNKHLNENGIRYFCALSKEFVLITTNTRHPAFNVEDENLHIIYQDELSLKDALIKLKSEYGCERITIQTGGTLNNLFLREKLFDYVDIIIAPVLIGGKDTSTLIDGKSLTEECELSKLGVVKLQECVVLENSYLRLRYEVIH